MDLFHLQDDAAGSVFWHPNGEVIYSAIQDYLSGILKNNGYQAVRSPQLYRNDMWKQSGHWDHFQDNIFKVEEDMLLKPMNCPAHIQIFSKQVVSHRDLPIRYSEFGCCHRNEPSGALHGIMRLRQFVQDDGHIFCARDHIAQEIRNFCDIVKIVYARFGFNEIEASISLRPDNRAGCDEDWDASEEALRQAVADAGISFDLKPGEGAFYGPKLEFALRDSQGRSWQCGTIQLDYVLPGRFGLSYADRDGEKEPVLIHRAILGSIERFIGILLEHHGADIPFWLKPVQVVVLPINQMAEDYAYDVARQLPFRVRVDCKDSLSKRIKRHHKMGSRILVVGEKEMAQNSVDLRGYGNTPLYKICSVLEKS